MAFGLSTGCKHPNPAPSKGVFLGLQNSLNRNVVFTSIVIEADSRPLFQKCSISEQDEWLKGRVAFLPLPEKNILPRVVEIFVCSTLVCFTIAF